MVSEVHHIIQSDMPQYFGILFSVDLRCSGDKCKQKIYRQLIRQTRPPKCCREFYFSDVCLVCLLLLQGLTGLGTFHSSIYLFLKGCKDFWWFTALTHERQCLSLGQPWWFLPFFSPPHHSLRISPRDQPFILHRGSLQSILT